ncbi:MAG: ABC transporter ATP-binding protein [Spirochaetales bacterium]|nr:ABC transporter ATP-binding protein [Spirochaetales bacterium]MBP7264486.1 ABC transporter ATP-binding protein [Spirochaetia bacterium]
MRDLSALPENAPLFSLRGLSFRYGRRVALRCDSLDIERGQAVALLGPNGSGKTTFLKVLNGLLGPYDGTLRFLGRSPGPALRLRSVYLHQHPVLFTGTVRDNLARALSFRRVPRGEAAGRVQAAIDRVGCASLMDREASRLSGGETQRVALARALALGADILFLDEPTSSMDAASQNAVRSVLAELKSEGVTLIFSTHDQELADALADTRILFDAGRAMPHPHGGNHDTSR